MKGTDKQTVPVITGIVFLIALMFILLQGSSTYATLKVDGTLTPTAHLYLPYVARMIMPTPTPILPTDGCIFPAPGRTPNSLAFDGTYLWSHDEDLLTFFKHQLDDNLTVVASYDSHGIPGSGAAGITWDGQNYWTIESVEQHVRKIFKRDADFSIVASYDTPEGCVCNDDAIEWDGSNFWAVSHHGFGEPGAKIHKLSFDGTSFAVAVTYDAPSTRPKGLAWDGQTMWSSDADSTKIYKHNMDATLSVARVYESANSSPQGITWIYGRLFSAYSGWGKIVRHNADISVPSANCQ